jgi:hypothetical protein
MEKHFAGSDRARLEMLMEAVIKRVSKYNWRLWSSDFGDAL